jgi:hypothetical protein
VEWGYATTPRAGASESSFNQKCYRRFSMANVFSAVFSFAWATEPNNRDLGCHHFSVSSACSSDRDALAPPGGHARGKARDGYLIVGWQRHTIFDRFCRNCTAFTLHPPTYQIQLPNIASPAHHERKCAEPRIRRTGHAFEFSAKEVLRDL